MLIRSQCHHNERPSCCRDLSLSLSPAWLNPFEHICLCWSGPSRRVSSLLSPAFRLHFFVAATPLSERCHVELGPACRHARELIHQNSLEMMLEV